MSIISKRRQTASSMVTFFHDIEQNIDSDANPEECRQMVKEFLNLEKKYGISSTYFVVGKLFEEQPDLIQWILQDGQEVAFHSFNHQSDWKPEYYTKEIDLCRNHSSLPLGYRSPRSQWDHTTLKNLWERGFLWNAEDDNNKEPYFIYKGLVRLPVAGDDWQLQTGTLTIDEWIQQFSELLKSKSYLAFGSHDYITSFAPEERLKAWERILQIAVENKSLIVNFSEAADLFRRASISRCCNVIDKKWNRNAKTLYRTKRFQEIVRAEAEKLNQPVICDLGFNSGVLSFHLKDIAKNIYSVCNDPGMITNADSDSCINECLGEATNSNLTDNSIDLVICAQIIEYLFFPDLLANEIIRIGKIGATFCVTFPALQSSPASLRGFPQDRIRHYFLPNEIKRWANQIGPGHLIGICDERPGFDKTESEERFQVREKTLYPDACPTDWIYIGTIQNKLTQKHFIKSLPVSVFNFSFPNQRYESLKSYLANVGRRFPKRIKQVGKWILYR